MNLDAKKSFLINLSFSGIVAILIYISVKFLLQYFVPFIVAFLIAWAVQKPAVYISAKLKIKRGTVAAAASLLFYLAVIFLFAAIAFALTSPIKNILNEIPLLLNKTGDLLNQIKINITSTLNDFSPDLSSQIGDVTDDFVENLQKVSADFFANLAAKTVTQAPNFLFSCIVALVAGCYIAKDFKNLLKFSSELIGKETYSKIVRIKNIFVNSILKIVKGYLILSLITFAILTVGFFILRLNYAPFLALLIAFVDLLPVLGTGIVLIPWGITELLWYNKTIGIILLAIYIVIILVRNFAEPKIIGKQIGVYPLFTLIAMFAGLKFMGFAGLIIFPVTLIVIINYYKDDIAE